MPDYRTGEIQRFTSELLEHALGAAAEAVKVGIPDELGTGTIRWGAELDVQQPSIEDEARRQRASYLAKYTTKSPEQDGGPLHRVDRSEIEHVQVRKHVRGYLKTAFELHDGVSDAIASDPPVDPPVPPAPRPAPATSRYPNELVLQILQAKSTADRRRSGCRRHGPTPCAARTSRCSGRGPHAAGGRAARRPQRGHL